MGEETLLILARSLPAAAAARPLSFIFPAR